MEPEQKDLSAFLVGAQWSKVEEDKLRWAFESGLTVEQAAQSIVSKSVSQCNDFLVELSHAAAQQKQWPNEDIELLRSLCRSKSVSWEEVASKMANHPSPAECKVKYFLTIIPWTAQEEKKLRDMVACTGVDRWHEFPIFFNHRRGCDIQHKWLTLTNNTSALVIPGLATGTSQTEAASSPAQPLEISTVVPPEQIIPIPTLPEGAMDAPLTAPAIDPDLPTTPMAVDLPNGDHLPRRASNSEAKRKRPLKSKLPSPQQLPPTLGTPLLVDPKGPGVAPPRPQVFTVELLLEQLSIATQLHDTAMSNPSDVQNIQKLSGQVLDGLKRQVEYLAVQSAVLYEQQEKQQQQQAAATIGRRGSYPGVSAPLTTPREAFPTATGYYLPKPSPALTQKRTSLPSPHSPNFSRVRFPAELGQETPYDSLPSGLPRPSQPQQQFPSPPAYIRGQPVLPGQWPPMNPSPGLSPRTTGYFTPAPLHRPATMQLPPQLGQPQFLFPPSQVPMPQPPPVNLPHNDLAEHTHIPSASSTHLDREEGMALFGEQQQQLGSNAGSESMNPEYMQIETTNTGTHETESHAEMAYQDPQPPLQIPQADDHQAVPPLQLPPAMPQDGHPPASKRRKRSNPSVQATTAQPDWRAGFGIYNA